MAEERYTPAVVTVPKKQTTTTTIPGVISAKGLIKYGLRLPQSPLHRKRKRGDSIQRVSKGTATRHYVSFLKVSIDKVDQYPHIKGHYLVMNNAPIHTSENIAKYVESRDYRCVCLLPYSPELNPIEQSWSEQGHNMCSRSQFQWWEHYLFFFQTGAPPLPDALRKDLGAPPIIM